MVLESADEVVERVIEFRRLILNRNQPAVVRTDELSTEDEVA
jgi:hypothetical protein